MQGIKEFYEEVSREEKLKETLEAVAQKRMDEARRNIIKDYIDIAKSNGFEISENDFVIPKKDVSQDAEVRQLGISSGCLLIDNGCTICGEINSDGGCILIGLR